MQRELHPVFGPGEDRNEEQAALLQTAVGLHPVFGPGEDRNCITNSSSIVFDTAAPGLRTG